MLQNASAARKVIGPGTDTGHALPRARPAIMPDTADMAVAAAAVTAEASRRVFMCVERAAAGERVGGGEEVRHLARGCSTVALLG